ncbi:hypothetical protein BIU88_00425 [Chlorobaculum limnaeum]|uniref:Coenzyme F420 hydrogenase/dehydrogenase beta subunit C-terminal domain-containing protein n=2 Tax=Chlorobaculum limnaeum TaxID=274537 RepID=A0A1D8D1X0_CHLLM|nr:hypothetical protein BIU88_00425 [Chlorobaculum limnaeum]
MLTCPVISDVSVERFKAVDVYAGWSLKDSIRTDSSSGGLFSELAEAVMQSGGKVFAATFDKNFKLLHREVVDSTDLAAFRGSKYLQGVCDEVYTQIATYLKQRVPVMFVGLPCQVAGLYGFLGGDNPNLLTCDLVCHGAPSQKIFDDYLLYLKNNGLSGFIGIDFRERQTSGRKTTIIYAKPEKNMWLNGTYDYYQQAFMRNLISRNSCYSCKFARIPRIGDITLGDYWGIGFKKPFFYDITKGVSLVITNSLKGNDILNKYKRLLFLEKRTIDEAVTKNPRVYKASNGDAGERQRFLADLQSMSITHLVQKYRLYPRLSFASRLRSYVKTMLGDRLVNTIRAVLKKRALRRI